MNQSLNNMIKQQLRTSAVLNESILSLFERLPRDQFVPQQYAAFAYSDMQIPLDHNQRMMTPSEEGLILQALQLTGNETVLEIGTGSGYFTALLSQSCKKVITFDIFPEFIEKAKIKLEAHDCHNIEYHTANGYDGWAEGAPYDCIIMNGGVPKLNDKLLLQLTPTGRLISFVGQSPVLQAQICTLESNKSPKKTFLFNTSLPPLTPLHQVTKFVF
jgi:protein-L-isoaspartate(D-aspartate) O-methyltransferase